MRISSSMMWFKTKMNLNKKRDKIHWSQAKIEQTRINRVEIEQAIYKQWTVLRLSQFQTAETVQIAKAGTVINNKTEEHHRPYTQ